MEPRDYGLLICRRLNWTLCQCIGRNLVPRASTLIARQKTWDNPTRTQSRTHAIVGSGYEIFPEAEVNILNSGSGNIPWESGGRIFSKPIRRLKSIERPAE